MVMSARSSSCFSDDVDNDDNDKVSSLIEKELELFTKVKYEHLCESHILKYHRFIVTFALKKK